MMKVEDLEGSRMEAIEVRTQIEDEEEEAAAGIEIPPMQVGAVEVGTEEVAVAVAVAVVGEVEEEADTNP